MVDVSFVSKILGTLKLRNFFILPRINSLKEIIKPLTYILHSNTPFNYMLISEMCRQSAVNKYYKFILPRTNNNTCSRVQWVHGHKGHIWPLSLKRRN